MRTIISMPSEDIEALDAIGRQNGMSRAAVIRRAIAEHLERHRVADPDRAYGLWRSRDVDGLEYQQRLRNEWPK